MMRVKAWVRVWGLTAPSGDLGPGGTFLERWLEGKLCTVVLFCGEQGGLGP